MPEIKRLCLATENSHIAANAMLLTKIDGMFVTYISYNTGSYYIT